MTSTTISGRTISTILNVAVATAAALAVLVPTLTAERPAAEGGWVAHSVAAATAAHNGKPKNIPTWKPAYARLGCSSTPALVDVVLVVDGDGDLRHMSLDEADHRAHDDSWADDVWVVGFCR